MLLHLQQPRSQQGFMAPRAVLAALWLVVAAHLLSGAAAVKPLSPFDSGILTHYGGAQDGMDPNNPSFGSKEGSCGYGLIPKERYPYFQVAALSPQNSFYKAGPLNGCGQCFEIQCQGKDCKLNNAGEPQSVVVMISDECPECEADHIDVQSLSFAKLANPAVGRIGIQYRRVECTPPTDMKVAIMDYRGAGGWIRLSIDDTGGRAAVKQVFIRGGGSGSWQAMTNSWGAAWEASSTPAAPLDVKVVCDDGEEVVAAAVVQQNGGISFSSGGASVFPTGKQFTISNLDKASFPSSSSQAWASSSSQAGSTSSGSSSSFSSAGASGGGAGAGASAYAQASSSGSGSSSASASSSASGGGAWASASASSGEPKVQSFSGPPNSGGSRRLLRHGALL